MRDAREDIDIVILHTQQTIEKNFIYTRKETMHPASGTTLSDMAV